MFIHVLASRPNISGVVNRGSLWIHLVNHGRTGPDPDFHRNCSFLPLLYAVHPRVISATDRIAISSVKHQVGVLHLESCRSHHEQVQQRPGDGRRVVAYVLQLVAGGSHCYSEFIHHDHLCEPDYGSPNCPHVVVPYYFRESI